MISLITFASVPPLFNRGIIILLVVVLDRVLAADDSPLELRKNQRRRMVFHIGPYLEKRKASAAACKRRGGVPLAPRCRRSLRLS